MNQGLLQSEYSGKNPQISGIFQGLALLARWCGLTVRFEEGHCFAQLPSPAIYKRTLTCGPGGRFCITALDHRVQITLGVAEMIGTE